VFVCGERIQSHVIFAISVTLQMVRRKRRGTICVEETNKVLDLLPVNGHFIRPIYKHVLAVDDCIARLKEERDKPKATTLYHLSKYVNQSKHKRK
jgi:hypothetical protein